MTEVTVVENEIEPRQEESELFPNVEKILDMVGDIAAAGRKVYLDKKVNLDDALYVLPVIQNVSEYIRIDFKAAVAEIKSPSIAKILSLVKLINDKVKAYNSVV